MEVDCRQSVSGKNGPYKDVEVGMVYHIGQSWDMTLKNVSVSHQNLIMCFKVSF